MADTTERTITGRAHAAKHRRHALGTIVIAGGALALWLLTVIRADFNSIGAYGLVSILHWEYFAGLALVVVGFAYEVLRSPMRSISLLIYVVLLVLFLFGTAPAIEPVAARADSWIHAGFIQYIFVHGSVLNNFDARFSWPGAFSLASVLVAFTGRHDAIAFLRWFPLVIELLYLAPMLVIARFSGVGRRAGWLGIALFYATDWIYQDYFSPQALSYFYLLVILAVVLALWNPRQIARRRRRRRRVAPDGGGSMAVARSDGPGAAINIDSAPSETVVAIPRVSVVTITRERLRQTRAIFTMRRIEGRDTIALESGTTTLALLALAGLITLAMAMSHQLTPYDLVLELIILVFARRVGRPEFVVLAALITVGWLSLGAVNFWTGHLNLIFGGLGQIGGTVTTNVANRVTGGTSHLIVVDSRILLTGGIYILAGIGAMRRACDSRALEMLAGAPLLLLATQSYGGEGLLRVALFGLPFTALLAAAAVLPQRKGTIRPFVPNFRLGRHARNLLRVVVAALVLGCAVLTTIDRGGNDAYEAFTPGELAAVVYAYRHASPNSIVGVVSAYLPYGQRAVGSVTFLSFDVSGNDPIALTAKNFLQFHPEQIILSQSQDAWGVYVAGLPHGWEASLEAKLVGHGYVVAASWPTAIVLREVPHGSKPHKGGGNNIAKLWT